MVSAIRGVGEENWKYHYSYAESWTKECIKATRNMAVTAIARRPRSSASYPMARAKVLGEDDNPAAVEVQWCSPISVIRGEADQECSKTQLGW